jgi:hypothetical protein
MSDVDTKVREILRELADEAHIEPVLATQLRRRIRRGRVVSGALAVAISAAVVLGAVVGVVRLAHVGGSSSIRPAGNPTSGDATPAGWLGIFPSDTQEKGQELQACADAGDDSCTPYRNFTAVLGGYGKMIWGSEVYYDFANAVARYADSSGPFTITIGQCIPGTGGFAPGCTVADVTLERLLRHDTTGVWFVTASRQHVVAVSAEAVAEGRIRQAVDKFMTLRLMGADQAFGFLSAQAKDSYDRHEGGLQLFGEGVSGNGFLFEHFEIQSIKPIDASSYEVQVYMLVGKDPGDQNAQDWVETLTVGPGQNYKGDAQPLVVGSAVLTSAQPRPAP